MREYFESSRSGPSNLNMEYLHAEDTVATLLEEGQRPIVTIPKQYAEDVRKRGIRAYETWISQVAVIAGTLGRGAYAPENSGDRILCRIKDVDISRVHPRMTGPDKAFHGVVTIDGPIDPTSIEIIDQPTIH